jgi:hypothetical protein
MNKEEGKGLERIGELETWRPETSDGREKMAGGRSGGYRRASSMGHGGARHARTEKRGSGGVSEGTQVVKSQVQMVGMMLWSHKAQWIRLGLQALVAGSSTLWQLLVGGSWSASIEDTLQGENLGKTTRRLM